METKDTNINTRVTSSIREAAEIKAKPFGLSDVIRAFLKEWLVNPEKDGYWLYEQMKEWGDR